MPNWCNNSVSITHSDLAKLRALVEAVNAGRFCDYAIPTPEDLNITAGSFGDTDKQAELEAKEKANLEKHGFKNWYDFQVSRWGTKWDVEAYDKIEFDPAGVTFGFDSAWSPPIGVYEALVQEGFSVCAFYYEPGMAYAGKWSDEDGDEYFELSNMTSEEVRAELPEDLDDVMCISENMAQWEEEAENE